MDGLPGRLLFALCVTDLKKHIPNTRARTDAQGGYIEVRPQGVHKGAFLDRVLTSMLEHGKQADFVLVIGDDASDEYMFTAAEDYAGAYACPVVALPRLALSLSCLGAFLAAD